jgi:hypothetical protein
MAGSKADIVAYFGGDVGGLEAAVAQANAILKNQQREVQKLAKEYATLGDSADEAFVAKFKAASASMAETKQKAKDLQAQLAALYGAADGGHGGGGGLHGAGPGFYLREVHALMDELGSGRSRQAVGTFSNLVSTFLQANTQFLPMAAGVGLVAGALGYMAYQAITADAALKSIQLGAAIAQFDLTADAATHLRDEIKKAALVGNTEAAEIAKPFLAIGPAGEQVAQLMVRFLPMMKLLGEEPPKAAEKLAEAFADLGGKGRKLVEETRGITAAQLQAYDSMVASGRQGEAMAVIYDAYVSRLGKASDALKLENAARADHVAEMIRDSQGVGDFGVAEANTRSIVEQTTEEMKQQVAAAAQLRAALQGVAVAQANYAAGVETALKVDKVAASIKATEADVERLNAGLATSHPGDAGYDQMAKSLSIATNELKKLRSESTDIFKRDDFKKARDDAEALTFGYRGTESALLRLQKAVYDKTVKNPNADDESRKEAARESLRLTDQIRDADYKSYVANEDRKVLALVKNHSAIIAERRQELAQTIAIYGEGSAKAEEAAKKVAEAEKAAAVQAERDGRKSSKDLLGATKEDIQAQIRDIEDQTAFTIDKTDFAAKTRQISEQQRLATVLAALNEEKKAVDAYYAHEMALAGLTQTEIARIRRERGQEDLKIAKQIMDEQEKSALVTQKAWDSATKAINSAFDSQISGLLRGTTSWHSAVTNVLAQLTEDGVKYFVNQGILAAENSLKQIALASTTQTAIAGTKAAGVAAERGINATAISGDAARAAAGAYAATAGIPIIGPLLAPAAAAVAFAGVEAFGAFDSGSWSVPRDQLAFIHQGETIIPQRGGMADEFRSIMLNGGFAAAAAQGGAASGGGSAASSGGGVTFNVSAIDAQGVAQFLTRNGSAIARSIAGVQNANPSTRPTF